jgi:glycosyltransferase involved in cell wall biosynthesis
MKSLMHDSNLNRIPLLGATVRRRLVQRVAEMRVATKGTSDPDVSIVIRSKNNAQQLQGLMEDIQAQVFEGGIEIIVVDTESTDGSAAIAQAFGARVVTITQANFSYPKSLNAGFEVATKSWVYTCVDHSALASRYLLKTITRWDRDPHVAGIWAFTLPNANASVWERLAYVVWMRRMLRMAHMARKGETGMGFMGVIIWRSAGRCGKQLAASMNATPRVLKIGRLA